MSLPALESSRSSGEPINLFLFTYGDGPTDYYAYTDAETYVQFGGVTYKPIPIDRGKLSSSGTLDKSNVTIITPQDIELAALYLVYPPSTVTTLVMYQGHVNDIDDDYRVVWSGRVLSGARKGSKAEFTCEPVSTSLRRNGLRRRYQYGCPHVLYGPDCKASKINATTTTQIVGVSGSRITLAAGWSGQAAGAKFVQGIAEWQSSTGGREVRTILRSENNGLTFLLSGTTRGLMAGSSVNMIFGCNHKSGTPVQPDGDCGPLHHNILNFGGQERIPFKNPIGLVNSFY